MTSNDGNADDESPWTKPWFIASGIVVALIVVLGAVLALVGPGDGSGTAETPPATAPVGPPPSDPSPNRSACGMPAGEQAIPDGAPQAKWELRGTIAAPSAPKTAGPRIVKDALPSCFAHSPTGALFATINIYAALSVLSQRHVDNPRAALRQLIAAGPGRDAAGARAGRGAPASKGSSSGVQVAGFSIVRYEAASAVIDVVFRVDRTGAAGYVHAGSTMRWERGDWKLVLSQAGQPFDSMQQIGDLSGYVPWSGV
jgi:hypothetical protein